MDVDAWRAIPPPPPTPPVDAPYGYTVPAQPWAAPPAVAPAPAAPPRRTWVAVTAVLLAAASVAVSVIAVVVRPATADPTGLHAVTAISAQPWTAEFVDSTGLPARWTRAAPIPYVINPEYAQPGATAEVEQAVARLEAASGLRFVLQGTTQERPTRGRQAYQPSAYGKAWAPVLISWSPPSGTDLLAEPKAEAVTVPVAVVGSHTGGGSIVSAEIVLNTDRQLPVGFGPGPSEGEVLMHELGHAVGLGHVSNIADAMYPHRTRPLLVRAWRPRGVHRRRGLPPGATRRQRRTRWSSRRCRRAERERLPHPR